MVRTPRAFLWGSVAFKDITGKFLGIREAEDRAERHIAIAVAQRALRPVVRVPLAIATLIVWIAFFAQIYMGEFLNYHPVRGWMNQPLVQLPWFRYVPGHLVESAKNAAGQLFESGGERTGSALSTICTTNL